MVLCFKCVFKFALEFVCIFSKHIQEKRLLFGGVPLAKDLFLTKSQIPFEKLPLYLI